MAYAVAVFLLLPTILIVPMSFGPDQYLRFPPNGFTLHWYDAYFKDADWIGATLFSVKIAVLTALAATLIGTLVSVALVRGRLPLKRVFELLVVGPVIVPNIALAIAMFLVFDRLRLTGTTFGFVGAHTALAMPFVVFTILASLYRFDSNLERAALSCGANPLQAFVLVTLPQIAPGIVSGRCSPSSFRSTNRWCRSSSRTSTTARCRARCSRTSTTTSRQRWRRSPRC